MLNETLEYLGIAFVSSAALIVLSKIILQALIRKPADYYSASEKHQEEMLLSGAALNIIDENNRPKRKDKSKDPEALEDIRKSLEQAYQQQIEAVQEAEPVPSQPEPEPADAKSTDTEPVQHHNAQSDTAQTDVLQTEPVQAEMPQQEEQREKQVKQPKYEWVEKPDEVHQLPEMLRGRKPSMKMKKAELTEIALSMGIVIPEKATKQVILDLIREKQNWQKG